MQGLDYAEKTYPFIDKNREAALGASYGGYMVELDSRVTPIASSASCRTTASSTPSRPTARPKSFGFRSGSSTGRPGRTGSFIANGRRTLFAEKFKTPTLVVHGQLDYRLDVSQGFELFTTLQRLKRAVGDALLPRRRSLGAEAAERPALVQDRERLGRSVDEAVTLRSSD